uniref:RNase H type-1 domain-containing protein n=1 Tax=Oryza brachyantha TaxID=4533 RepID=J3MRS2_ORYBR
MEWIHMPIILETNNAEVFEAFSDHAVSRSPWEAIIKEARGMMQCLQSVQVFKIKREVNRIANALAQMAMRSRLCAEWKVCAPPGISELIDQECNPLF